MTKFTFDERTIVKSIIANLSLRRISDDEIIKEIERQTSKIISRQSLYNLRQQIKKESYDWYKSLWEGQYEYIHQFKERINEILWLQQKHRDLINNNKDNPQIQQASLADLHRLNITLSNYFNVTASIVNGISLPTTSERKTEAAAE